jgi:hypothetical protein
MTAEDTVGAPTCFEVTLKYADWGRSRGTSDRSMEYKFQNNFLFLKKNI